MFATFEGGEGSGKTTQAKLFYQYLIKNGVESIYCRDPGGSKIAEEIRHILLRMPDEEKLCNEAELMLYIASRAQSVNDVIRPALKDCVFVVGDRFYDSTSAYQGVARGWGLDFINTINTSLKMPVPDITFLYDIEPELGLKRSISRLEGNNINEGRFEVEKLEFHQKVRDGYHEIVSREPKRFIVIPVSENDTIDQVHKETIRQWENIATAV